MSHQRISQFAQKENVQELLQGIGSQLSFGPEYSQLLEEYRSLGYGPQAAMDRAAAVEAYTEIRDEYPGLTLDEMGVSLPLQDITVYNSTYGHRITPEEKQYIEATAEANKKFLDLWDKKRKKLQEDMEGMDMAMDTFKTRVTDIIEQSDIDFRVPSVVICVLREAGFVIEQEFSFNPADYSLKGIAFTALHANGDSVEVRMTNTGVNLHVHDRKNLAGRCQRTSGALNAAIERGLKSLQSPLGRIVLQTGMSGYGGAQGIPAEASEENIVQNGESRSTNSHNI